MTLTVYAPFLLIGAGLLSSAIIEVSGQDDPPEEFCTPVEMDVCYVQYQNVLWDAALGPDHDGHFNNTAYHIACNAITEKSSCHKTIEKCPQKARTDFTRQEKGYQLMRGFVCDFELFRDFRRAVRCESDEKMRKCEPSPPKIPEQTPVSPNGGHCRYIIDGWVCREGSLHPDCSARYKRAKESYSKAREAVALLTGCDYDPSVISSEAPSTQGPPSAGQPSAVPPSAVPASGAPSSEGSSSTGHPSEAPPSLAPPSVTPLGIFLYIPTIALIRWMNN